MRKMLLLLFLMMGWVSQVSFAQFDNIDLDGALVDDFTYELINGAHVELLDSNGTVLQTDTTRYKGKFDGTTPYNLSFKVARNITTYTLRCTAKGYEPQEVTVDLHQYKIGKKTFFIQLGHIRMHREAKALGEATVVASKVMMVMKGDTLVYNADAFQLSNGSMLDALIKQLPGVELDGAQIKVNGKFVSSLLINGENFFKGDPRVALENLPAYMVNKVKVYEKEKDYAYLLSEEERKKEEHKEFVMDVNLKREYSIGWIANAEIGAGTHDTYLGRLFGLRFTNNSRLSFVGSVNNLGETGQANTQGNWQSIVNDKGNSTVSFGGFDYLVKDKKGKWKVEGDLKLRNKRTDTDSRTNATSFLSSGNIYSLSHSQGFNINTSITSKTEIRLNNKKYQLQILPLFSYQHNRNHTLSHKADLNSEPKDNTLNTLDSIFVHGNSSHYWDALIYRMQHENINTSDSWKGKMDMKYFSMLPYDAGMLDVRGGVNFEETNIKNYSLYDIQYSTAAQHPYQRKYTRQKDTKKEAYLEADIDTYGKHYFADLSVSYHFTQQPSWRNLYQLDNYNEYGVGSQKSLRTLPSTRCSLQQVIDLANSLNAHLTSHDFRVSFHYTQFLFNNKHNVSFDPGIRLKGEVLEYHRDVFNINDHRWKWAFEPAISTELFQNRYKFYYKSTVQHPAYLNTLPITDTSTPLYEWIGNPSQKAARRHTFTFKREWVQREKGSQWFLKAEHAVTTNAHINKTVYDRTTGTTFATPSNINGNWMASLNLDGETPLDKAKQFFFSSATNAAYHHSVDWITTYDALDKGRSSVENYRLEETLKLNMRLKKKGNIILRSHLQWTHADSKRTDFSTINCFDFDYGFSLNYALPYNFDLSTDFFIYSRRGYEDHSMNTNDIVWNGKISTSILNKSLVISLRGFDILHQLKGVRRTLTAQGRTETLFNTQPSYLLLSILYKFSKQPKKK